MPFVPDDDKPTSTFVPDAPAKSTFVPDAQASTFVPDDFDGSNAPPGIGSSPFDQAFTGKPEFGEGPLKQLDTTPPPGYERSLATGGLQPAGLYDPKFATRTPLEEDVRRVGEFAETAPQRLASWATTQAERITDLPLSRIWARQSKDAHTKTLPPEWASMVPNPGPTAAEVMTEKGGPNLYEQSVQDTKQWLEDREQGPLTKLVTGKGNEGAPTPNLDFPIGEGVSARQLVNHTAHSVIGRGTKAFQESVGHHVIAPLGLAAVRELEKARDPNVDAMSGNQLGPEGRELLARELLSFYDPTVAPERAWGFDDKRYQSAVEQLEKEYGTGFDAFGLKGIGGAAHVQATAHELGGLPVYLWTSGLGEAAAMPATAKAAGIIQKLPKMTKVAAASPAATALRQAAITGGVVEGGVQGFLQGAAKDGEDVFRSAGYGALLGGVLGFGAGLATAKKQAVAMSKDFHAGMALSRAATNDFLKELDEVIQPPQSFDELRTMTNKERPDFEIIAEQSNDIKPTGSYFTVDKNTGQKVLRDFEATAVQTAPRQKAKTNQVQVQRKGELPKTVEPKATSLGEGLEVRIKYRDTPVADPEAAERLVEQAGRKVNFTLEDDIDKAAYRGFARDDQMVGGSMAYMPKEQLLEWKPGVDKAVENKFGAPTLVGGGNKTVASRKPRTPTLGEGPTVVTVADDGRLETTLIKASPPKQPASWEMKGGDTVLIDGNSPGTVVSTTPAAGDDVGRITVELRNGQKVQVDSASVTHVPREMAPEMPPPLISAKPSTLVDPRTEGIVRGIEQGTTVTEMMKIAGRPDPTWAASALRNMEARGLVYEMQPGLFVPTRVKAVKPPQDPGTAVFIGTGGPNNRGEIGVLRGKDPRNPKNWIVEVPSNYDATNTTQHPVGGQVYAKTKHVSVPEEAVRNMKPVGLANKANVDPGIDMYGWNKPMPPSFYQQSPATMGDQQLMTRAWSAVNNQPGLLQRSAQAIKEAFAGPMHLASPELRQSAAQKLFGLAGMAKSEGLSRTQYLAKRLELGTKASEDLTKVMLATRARNPNGATSLNEVALKDWVAKYPVEAAASISDFQAMLKEADDYSRFLADRGIANVGNLEAARAAGLEEEYLTRTYQAFMMPRQDWAKYARKNLTTEWDNALQWLYNNRPNHWNDFGTTAAEFDEILNLENPIKGLEQAGYIKAEGAKKLLTKEDVPEPLRRLLGEHTDAAVRLGFGTAWQRQLVKSIQGWDAVADNPNLWSPGWRADMTLRVPAKPSFGRAANGFVPDNPTMRGLLGERSPNNQTAPHAALRAIGWLGQKWKAAHTVYNQVSWANNAVRTLKGVLLSGGFSNADDFNGFRDAARMLLDYGNNPTVYGPNKLLVEAMDFDAVGPGLAGSELRYEEKRFADKMLRIFMKGRNGPNPFMDALAEARETALGVPEKIHNGYDFVDRWAKFGSYLNLRRNYIAQGYSVDDAAAKASLDVNSFFQNFQRTPEHAKKVAGNFALAAPFLSSKLEDVRINATVTKRLLSGDFELAMRAATLGAVFGGAQYLANSARRANGISDEQDAKEKASLPLRVKERHPWLVGSLDYDNRKRRMFFDLTPYEDLLASFKGNVNDPLMARILFNNAMDIMGEQSMMGDLANRAGAFGGLHTPDPQAGPRPDQQGPLSLMQYATKGFMPQGLMNALRNEERMDPSGRMINPEAFTPDQALFQTMTGRINALTGEQTDKQSAMEKAGIVRGAGKDIGAAAMDAALHKVSGERQKHMIKANVRELKQQLQSTRPLKKE